MCQWECFVTKSQSWSIKTKETTGGTAVNSLNRSINDGRDVDFQNKVLEDSVIWHPLTVSQQECHEWSLLYVWVGDKQKQDCSLTFLPLYTLTIRAETCLKGHFRGQIILLKFLFCFYFDKWKSFLSASWAGFPSLLSSEQIGSDCWCNVILPASWIINGEDTLTDHYILICSLSLLSLSVFLQFSLLTASALLFETSPPASSNGLVCAKCHCAAGKALSSLITSQSSQQILTFSFSSPQVITWGMDQWNQSVTNTQTGLLLPPMAEPTKIMVLGTRTRPWTPWGPGWRSWSERARGRTRSFVPKSSRSKVSRSSWPNRRELWPSWARSCRTSASSSTSCRTWWRTRAEPLAVWHRGLPPSKPAGRAALTSASASRKPSTEGKGPKLGCRPNPHPGPTTPAACPSSPSRTPEYRRMQGEMFVCLSEGSKHKRREKGARQQAAKGSWHPEAQSISAWWMRFNMQAAEWVGGRWARSKDFSVDNVKKICCRKHDSVQDSSALNQDW